MADSEEDTDVSMDTSDMDDNMEVTEEMVIDCMLSFPTIMFYILASSIRWKDQLTTNHRHSGRVKKNTEILTWLMI